jgi:putative ABC transport system permease protein
VTVVGVVPDVITNVTLLEPLALYFPMAQQPADFSRSLAIRVATEAAAVLRDVPAAIRQLDPAIQAAPLMTMSERIERQMGPQQLGSAVLGTLGLIALLLTILGTYVVAESMATLRTREMGIRGALGATRRQLGGLMLAETTRMVGAGILAGLVLAWVGARTIRAFLFQVEPFDPLTLTAVAVVILLLALAVALRPALRASRLDLASVLRHE